MSRVHPFDETATALAVIGDDGTLLEWSEGARRLLGHPADAVVGRPAAELLAVDGPAPVPAGTRWQGTVPLRHRDGRSVPVRLLAHRRAARGGRPGDWVVVTAPERREPDGGDDPLIRAALLQSPCPVAVFDERLRLRSTNDAMAAILGLPGDMARGLRITETAGRPESEDLERAMLQVLETERPLDVQTFVRTGGEERPHAWLARMAPVTDDTGTVRGVCLAVHDITEIHQARQRLQLVNEASMRIGSTLDITRTAQELADVCVPVLADFVTVDLLDPEEYGGEPPARVTAPVGLRRVAQQSVLPGVPEAVTEPGRSEVYPEGSPQADSLTAGRTILAEVPPGRVHEWLDWDSARGRRVREFGMHASMSVPIQARGLVLGVAVLTRHRRPDPFTADDILLAEEITTRAAVCIDNARRYSRERDTALALQRSLLPRNLPRTAALEAASRYLPACAGVGGDWFDVIPLSGMRVAMAVGDVIGHGIQASAAMGRLRTAVRTLADIDLAPDELLTHLDDLVVTLSEESGGEGSPGEVGATCLYAVYDPVSRRCAVARAGHPPPVMVPPGGEPRLLDVPAGPALGVGGLPFESVEVELPEGTVLALYTDGLTECRQSAGAPVEELLFRALGAHTESLEDACDRVLRTMLPVAGDADDDVALLLARTQGLSASQVATWDIPADPALVAPIRKQVVAQLERWSLSDLSFTAELVVSELVTNAIRYGARPIRLRLIQDGTTLICEVSDTSHTAPHLRRAKIFDEGGRGLLLVAQLTQRWGSRHTADGKTIWAELSSPDGEPAADGQ
ncbi:SpoIIE family protein phosphatase [Streptomyces sp. NPDC005573]|uniref:SpoIIE family protein phosphatase n=1 Tax=unclassified Streptomyces TaxID=2593676 RepID=UPI0033A02DC5